MLGASVHAGDMTFPPTPPPEHITSAETSTTTDDHQGIQSLAVSETAADVSIIAFDLFCDLLSVY